MLQFFWLCDLSGLLIAMVVSMLFLLLLRFTAPVMVWLLIIGVLGAGAYGKHSADTDYMDAFFIFRNKPRWFLNIEFNLLIDILISRNLRFCSFSIAGIWHCYWEYDNFKQQSASISDVGFTTNFKVYLQVQETWLAFCESDLDVY